MRYILLFITLALPLAAQARPVSYPGGWTVMQMNDADSSSLHVHYSPTARYSVGYKAEWWNDAEWQFQGAQVNFLVKRWNNPASQANIYLKSALGFAHSDYRSFDNKNSLAGFTGIAADWEDRRFFTMYENRLVHAGDINTAYMQKARLGIAPYEGDYGDLHTWLMLQVEHNPEAAHEVTYTPMVRFFKDVYLAEIGINNHGDALLNTIIRF